MRAASATANSGRRRHRHLQLQALREREPAGLLGHRFDQRARLERLGVDLQPAGLALGERQEVAQLRVQQHRRAPHPADQLVVALEGAGMAHLDHVERRDDALQRRAQLVADLGEEGAARQGQLMRRGGARPLFLDRADPVEAAEDGMNRVGPTVTRNR